MVGVSTKQRRETRLSTKLVSSVGLAITLLMLIFVFANGCKSMADPENSDLSWAERPEWEFAPAVPQSMYNR